MDFPVLFKSPKSFYFVPEFFSIFIGIMDQYLRKFKKIAMSISGFVLDKNVEKHFKICNSVFNLSYFGFVTVNALVYVNIDLGIHCKKSKIAQNEKSIWGFLFQKYGRFRSSSLELFVEHKP